MLAIFTNMVEKCIEVFMDDFLVFGPSFDCCITNLELVLQREETNLVQNWEKFHFMVQEGIVLGHKISANYVLMMNIYSTFDRWGDVERLKESMTGLGVKIPNVWSWIQF